MDSTNRVIVYGTDTQIGLSIVRELGKHGCHVIGIGKNKDSLGLRSGYVSEKHVLTGKTDEEKTQFINLVTKKTGAQYLMCVSEDDILFFNRVKNRLMVKALVPDLDKINKVLSKQYTAEIAASVGITTPKSYQIDRLQDLNLLRVQLRFPVILKWSNPHEVIAQAHAQGIRIEKIVYIHSSEELQQAMSTFETLNAFPMIQEYCPGIGLGQFFYMHEGKALLRFQHHRLHEWPPEGGFSTLCKSVSMDHHLELQEKSIALLRAMKWEGVAMVEYRYDAQSDSAVLMEINGRFWGSLPLAYHSRVPFAWFTYMIQGRGTVPALQESRIEGLYCRNVLVEIKRLIRILFQPGKIQDKTLKFNRSSEVLSFFTGYFNPKMRYYLYERNDISPLFADWKILLKKLLKR